MKFNAGVENTQDYSEISKAMIEFKNEMISFFAKEYSYATRPKIESDDWKAMLPQEYRNSGFYSMDQRLISVLGEMFMIRLDFARSLKQESPLIGVLRFVLVSYSFDGHLYEIADNLSKLPLTIVFEYENGENIIDIQNRELFISLCNNNKVLEKTRFYDNKTPILINIPMHIIEFCYSRL